MKSKKEKGRVLQEFCVNTGMNRKWVIQKIRSGQYLKLGQKQTRKQRGDVYANETIQELKRLWKVFEYPCGQRMESILREELDHLVALGEVKCSKEATAQLKTISGKTIDRKLADTKKDEGLKNKYQKKIHPILYQHIPVKVFAEQNRDEIGNIQADLVEHCGQSASGQFILTLSATCISSGWWLGKSVANMSKEAVQAGVAAVREESPFVWRSFHSDNDKLFINSFLYEYCRKEGLPFSRSRPYKKNDNCLVENKNKTHVRQVVGYWRYDTLEELEILNELWEKLASFRNFFMPSMKLVKKERIKSHMRRVYDRPLTPYRRIMNSDQIDDDTKRELRDIRNSLNPVRLQREIEKLRTALYESYQKKHAKPKGRSVRFLRVLSGAVSVR